MSDTRITVQSFAGAEQAGAYELALVGDVNGERGFIARDDRLNEGTYTVRQILLSSGGQDFVRAILPKPVGIPAALIEKDADRLRKAEAVQSELQGLEKKLATRFKAIRAESFRRLLTIEIDWAAKDGDKKGAFLDVAGGNIRARGEAKLALALLYKLDDLTFAAAALVELRTSVDVEITVQGISVKRSYGVVCRCGMDAAATISLDLDDFNLSLPEIALPSFDLLKLPPLKLPDVSGPLAGAFSRLTKGLVITYQWKAGDEPHLVVQRVGDRLLFAIMQGGQAPEEYDLTRVPTKLATLEKATVTKDAFRLEAKNVTLAVHSAGTIATGELTASGELRLADGSRQMGPLRIDWKEVVLTPQWGEVKIGGQVIEPALASARASLKFGRLTITVIDDPAAFLTFQGEIEVTMSGARVVELKLVEPYPIELLARGAASALRGAQKILQFLARLEPPAGDTAKLKKLLDAVAKIGAAIARAAVLVADSTGEILTDARDLLASSLAKVGELLATLFARLGDTLSSLTPLPSVDVEIRVALDPLELRQVMITLRGPAAENQTKKLSALGLNFELPAGWRPALLLDFVTEPGVYLLVTRPDVVNETFASVSTDLWLRRPDEVVAPVRDAAGPTGERDPNKPLIQVTLKRKAAEQPLFLVSGGISRGEAVFFRYAGDPKNLSVQPVEVPVPGSGAVKVSVLDRPFALQPLNVEMFDVGLEFQPDRVLALLGMGEPGKEESGGGGFLDKLKKSLSQVVWVEKVENPKIKTVDGKTVVTAALLLNVKAAGITTQVRVELELNESFEVKLTGSDSFALKSKRIEERALGLTWVVEQTDPKALKDDTEVAMFTLAFSGGESGLTLNKKEARMELRFSGLSSDGQGLVFDIEEFHVGRGGLDLVATVRDRAVRLNGIDVPFRFASGRLEVRGGKLLGAVIVGRGQLPPELVGEANCTAAFTFAFENGEIVLQSGKVELDKKGEPIVCHSTRFTLTVTDLDIAFVRDNGYHFYFLVTGSLRFTPKSGEFEDGLLKHLSDVEISLERAPLTADPRVLLRHISFQKALNPKKTFSLFNLFTFELRGFGFHPASPKFEGRPAAVNVSGQIRFAQIGDVMQPKIDFHGLWIAPPKKGESLPRIKADGLGVDLQLAGAVKVRGSVLAVDPDTRTVEGRELAPDGYNTYGFLGEGALEIPGWGMMEASLGFLEVEKKDAPGERKMAFFLYLQKNKLAVEIPTGIWTFYLREAGFGFGYRYTLAGIADAENAKSVAQLVKTLDDVSRRQGDLARYSAWKADPEKDNFTLAMRAAFQPMVAQATYDEPTELKAVSPFFFDIVAALRSDFTFLMSARAWLGVNYATFLANKDNFRERPGIRGFLYISVPRSELLLRAIADSKGFIGEDFPLFAKGMILRRAVEAVDWTTTLYIRPGLFHFEMGWPDQLRVRLVDEKNMRVIVRGGMIFRAAEDGLLFGFNIGAEAFLRFEGRAGGSIGVALVAELNATFVARVLSFTTPSFRGSLVYGLIALDARVTFSVQAWMEVDLGFTSFTLRIGFSFSLQLTAAVELAISDTGVGGRVAARVAVQVFGCSLGVGVGFSFNDRQLEAARARVQRFLAMSITAEEPASPPVLAATTGDKAIGETAKSAEAVHKAPGLPPTVPNADPKLKPSIFKSDFGRKDPPGPTDFYLVLRRATVDFEGKPLPANEVFAYALLVPKEATDTKKGGFYTVPGGAHEIRTDKTFDPRVQISKPGNGFEKFVPNQKITPRWEAPIAVPGGQSDTFTLGLFFDECFLADTKWEVVDGKPKRIASNWREPKELRVHRTVEPLTSSRDARNQERELQQKAHAAEAIERPYDERAYQARSTVMTMFIDQFLTLAAGKRSSAGGGEAHVTDLGLVLFGPVQELEKLGDARLIKHGEKNDEQTGTIEVFNPRKVWFDEQDPILADDRSAVETDGIKLDWRLSMPEATAHPDPDHFIDHYEVLRTIEGSELGAARQPMRVKPSPTIGARKDDTIVLVPPDWQFVDTLDQDTGVSPAMRRALLPAYGEVEGLDAAKAWLEVFGGVEEVTVTYSVTPVDCAGVRGLPRSFTVDVRRPQPPIRPAIGELRMVQTIPRDTPGAQNEEKRPENLRVFLALNDRAWKEPATQAERVLTLKGVNYTVERRYRLVVDPEDVEPAGHYGSDAATSRVRGPGAFAPKKTADERSFVVKRSETLSSEDPKIKAVEPNDDERKNLPIWADLSKNKDLLDLLWQRPDAKVRVASRFFLETLIVFTPADPKGAVEHVSKRVALPVEHVIERPLQIGEKPEEAGQTIATLRPEAFEWAVPLVLPPLGEGQVHTESGFARFRVPKPGARLGDLKNCGEAALDIARDPERRVLTTVRFAAVPDWAGGTVANAPKPLHGSSIAGFDLYELDLDDLAPLDVTTEPEHLKLADDASAWRRARRVARIEHLSREDARLVPTGNADWQGWQAHYPSETQRLQSAREGRPGESKPIRAAWYSDRETTPHFAVRRPRLRLLPLAPETAIAELMRGGRPDRVIVSLSGPSALAGQPLVLYDVTVNGVSLQGFKDPEGGEIKKRDGSTFEAHDLRNLLLCLGWKPFDSKNPAAFDGLTLVVEAKAEFAKDQTTIGRVEIPLDFRSPLHPLLEEVIAELALDVRDTVKAAVYRRYTVMPQPVTPVAAKDFSGLMAATAPETDPYGWKVLQTLGTAVTVRLYDGAEEAFVAPETVKMRVNEAFSAAIERWRKAYGEEGDAVVGQPFAEVFLRPGADRLAGPFDAVLKKEIEAEEPPCLALDDQGLAFVQLSLRPRPARAWNYMKQELVWKRLPLDDKETKVTRLLSVAIRIASRTEDVDILCDRTGSVAEVPGGGQIALIPIPAPREVNEKVTLYFRLAGETALAAQPEMQLVLELENRADGKRRVQTFLLPNADAPIEAPAWQQVETPGTELLDPFDRFPAISAEKWAAAMAGTNKVAENAFQSLRALVGTAFPADFIIPPPAMIAATYLTWTQRFLDHASSQTENERTGQPCLAIAAPTKASPWKLAADGEGYLTLTFLHSDRWAHARAYAVRSAGRYHEVLAGIGIAAEERVEMLEKAEKRPIGYAVAVSPRTEKIEPPVIVQARLAKSVAGSEDPEELVTEILVARHGEEALAASNRPLLARLGVPTSLLAFSRAYRAPDWPERLNKAFPDVPRPDLYPVRAAELPKSDALAKQIDGAIIQDVAAGYPSLWKGADLWHVAPLPPHYRILALASERAGVVVSNVAKVELDDQPRRPLSKLQPEVFPEGSVAIDFLRDEGEGGKRVRLELTHRLVSHALLTIERAETWLGHGKTKDVCWWPDPDVLYVLKRRGESTEEEDSETRLVASVDGDAANPQPIVLRARGPRYRAAEKGGKQLIEVTAAEEGDKLVFTLKTSLEPRTETGKPVVDTAGLTPAECGSEADIDAFNEHAALFAAILTPHELTFDLAPETGEPVAAYVARLRPLRNEVMQGVDKLLQSALPWIDRGFPEDLARGIAKLDQAIAANPATIEDLRKNGGLPLAVTPRWRPKSPLPDALAAAVAFRDLGAGASPPPLLAVWDLAASGEIKTLQEECEAPVAQEGGRLYVRLARRILGEKHGFVLQANDTRTRMTLDTNGKPVDTPGLVETEVPLPSWLAKAAQQGGSL